MCTLHPFAPRGACIQVGPACPQLALIPRQGGPATSRSARCHAVAAGPGQVERLAEAVKRSVSGGQPWQLLVTGTIMGQLKVGAGNRYNWVGVGVRGGKSGDVPRVLSWDSSRWGKGRVQLAQELVSGAGTEELGCPGGATASKRILRSREGFHFWGIRTHCTAEHDGL